VALIVAVAVAVVLTPIVAAIARRLGVVDRPGPLKVQDRPVAYLGGVAVFAALAGPVVASRAALLVPLGVAVLLGLADDIADLTPRWRLAGEVAIGGSAVAVLPTTPSPLGAAAVVVVVLLLLNAVNLLDGLDGLASSVGAVAALGFAVVLDPPDRTVAMALAGALLGFLVWNRPPARIYLGDAGSYLTGTALALLLVLTGSRADPVSPTAGALLFLAVPVADTTVAIVRRQRAGRPLMVGDRGHIYDQLVDRAWPAPQATAACAAAQAVLVGIGVAAGSLTAAAALLVVVAVVAVVGGVTLWIFTSPASWTT